MRVFINNIFISDKNIEYIELVIHNEKTLSNSFMLSNYESCEKFCKEKKEEGWVVYPLKGDTLELNPKFHRITRVPRNIKLSRYLKKEDSLLSIYSLYWDLAYYNAVYLDDIYKYPEGYIGYLSEFSNINIHKDCMRISIPVFIDNKVIITRDLISQDPNPRHHSFKVAVPKESVVEFYKYNLIEGDDLILNNKLFTVMEYKQNLSIYRCLSDFKFSESVVIYYGNIARAYEILLSLIKYALEDLKCPVEEVVDIFKKENLTSSSLFNNSSGVFINHLEKFPTRDEIVSACNLVNSIYNTSNAFLESTNVSATKGIRNLIKNYKMSKDFELAMVLYLRVLIKSKGDEINLVEGLVDLYKDSKLKVLESEIYLYNIRTSCMVNPSSLDYKDDQMMFYIKGHGNTMRMEVW